MIFILLALSAFTATQLIQLYYFQKWCANQSTPIPSTGLNRLWKNIYSFLETRLSGEHQISESPVNELRDIRQGDYGLVLLKEHKILWFNKSAAELLTLDSERDIGTDINYSLRVPYFMDALNEKRYGCDLVLENRQPPIAVCLLPYRAAHICMLVRDHSRFVEIKNTNRELIGNVAHELRSPLTVISGYLEILEDADGKTKDRDYRKILDNMQVQVARMRALTEDTLNLAYLENTKLEDHDQSYVNVPTILKTILESPKLNNRQCRIDTRIEDLRLWGSATELYSVFHNLIDNAICHSQCERIEVVWRRDDDGAYFEVIDKGIGIEAHHLPKLSQRFYRVDQARSGSKGNAGLGLSIVKHVLDRHQAILEIESEIGKGSVFRCRFPSTRIMQASAKGES